MYVYIFICEFDRSSDWGVWGYYEERRSKKKLIYHEFLWVNVGRVEKKREDDDAHKFANIYFRYIQEHIYPKKHIAVIDGIMKPSVTGWDGSWHG